MDLTKSFVELQPNLISWSTEQVQQNLFGWNSLVYFNQTSVSAGTNQIFGSPNKTFRDWHDWNRCSSTAAPVTAFWGQKWYVLAWHGAQSPSWPLTDSRPSIGARMRFSFGSHQCIGVWHTISESEAAATVEANAPSFQPATIACKLSSFGTVTAGDGTTVTGWSTNKQWSSHQFRHGCSKCSPRS